jgi:hypothetical protein
MKAPIQSKTIGMNGLTFNGWSQGAGNSALIAAYSVVPRVAMLSGVPDILPTGPGECQARTRGSRLTRLRPTTIGDSRTIRIRVIRTSVPTGIPWRCRTSAHRCRWKRTRRHTRGTHMLFTDLPQRTGYKAAHPSTLLDFYTPLFPKKIPELADAWQYMLTAPGRNEGPPQ